MHTTQDKVINLFSGWVKALCDQSFNAISFLTKIQPPHFCQTLFFMLQQQAKKIFLLQYIQFYRTFQTIMASSK